MSRSMKFMVTNSIITNCNHKFHASCLLHWLSIGKNCPYCSKSLIDNNIQATNIQDLKRQILETERLRLKVRIKNQIERINNEINPLLIRERGDLKYLYWNNFKEYCDYYNQTIEDLKDFIIINMEIKCKIINEGNVLRIKGIFTSENDIHLNFKIHFVIK